jgi:hypothetical protein
MEHITISSLLGLNPLDRVLLRPLAHEVRLGYTSGWCFFRRSLPCGRIEIASPTGIKYSVDPLQIEDTESRGPVQVLGLSERAFLDTLNCRGKSEYSVTYNVLGAMVSRGSFTFELHDPSTGESFGTAGRAIIHPESWRELMALARRDVMPVRPLFGRLGVGAIGGGSADRDRRRMASAAAREIRKALAGRRLNSALAIS